MNLLRRFLSTITDFGQALTGTSQPTRVTRQATDVNPHSTVNEGRVMMYVYLISMSACMVVAIVYRFCVDHWAHVAYFIAGAVGMWLGLQAIGLIIAALFI